MTPRAKWVRDLPSLRVDADGETRRECVGVAVEEPLEIRVCGDTLGVTLRTPGHDEELAAGLLYSEGIVTSLGELGGIARCGRPGDDGFGNVIDVSPAPGVTLHIDDVQRRGSMVTSSCGVCGRRSIDDLERARGRVEGDGGFTRTEISRLAALLSDHQTLFAETGGVHAAGAATRDGFVVVREDVGRHNAVDKVVGRLLLDDRLPATAFALFVSGRASFEIVQKACCAKIPILAAVSAPSSLAVQTAERLGVTLVGFCRSDGFRIYSHRSRLDAP